MSKLDLLGPRVIDVVQSGRDIFEGRQWINPYGQPGVKIFDRHVGTTSGLPFDNTVRDFGGLKIGVLEGFSGGGKTLRKW